jgi:hypothetical protein
MACSAHVPTSVRPVLPTPPHTHPDTVFDLLYDEYLPFRLYADYMLGVPIAELAKQFRLSENWVAERIEAVRLCIGKQLRVNLLDPAGRCPVTQ